jgi:hypothetical protein
MSSDGGLPTFAESFELVAFPEGALLVNLATGAYFGLNSTAALICGRWLEGASDGEAAQALAEKYGLSLTAAGQAVRDLAVALRDPPAVEEPPGPLRYRQSAWGYRLDLGGRPTLEVSRDGAALRLAGAPPSEAVLTDWARSISSKILSLQGIDVLHGAACEMGGGLVALCGQSGAGKTTTARALAAAGRPMFCEDLLVLHERAPEPQVVTGAEVRVRQWAAATARALAASPAAEVNARPLAATALSGGPTPLAALLFMDAARRGHGAMEAEAIAPLDCLSELLRANFLGSSAREDWRRFVALNTTLARSLPAARLRVPDGLEALQAAARGFDRSPAYSTSSTS